MIAFFVLLAAAVNQGATIQTAIAEARAGHTQEAIRQFRAILASSPRPEVAGQARLELVRIYQKRGAMWESAEQLRELRKLAPTDPEYAYELGAVYRSLSKWAFERMRTIAPNSALTQRMLGEQYSITGDSDKAVAAYTAAIAADPKLAGSHLALAVLYLRLGNRQDAKSEIQKELEIAPESAAAKQVLQTIESSR